MTGKINYNTEQAKPTTALPTHNMFKIKLHATLPLPTAIAQLTKREKSGLEKQQL